ncbi:MAG: hypothetical protein ABJF88_02445 [Rhodothermales bacterium]
MTEEEHIEAIRAMLPERGSATSEALDSVEHALEDHPQSASLWCLRGHLIQLSGDDEDGRELMDALRSYKQALSVDPTHVEAYREIGHFYDAVLDRPEEAQPYFELAEKVGRSQNAKH